MRRFNLEILPADGVPVDVDRKLASGDRLQLGVLAHPQHHPLGRDEVREHHLGWRFDVDRGRKVSHLSAYVPTGAWPPPRRLASARPGGWARTRQGNP